MSDTPPISKPPETPVEWSRNSDAPTNGAPTDGDGASLKDLYDDYLVRCDTALRDGAPLPPLPAALARTSFAQQAESGVRLLRLLARAHDTVMRAEVPARFAAPAPLERVAHFRLLRELGRGGHGVVYLAVDERLGRQVALKIPRPETILDLELRTRFLREAQAAGQLDHPNIVPVHEVGESGSVVFIASHYVEGSDLGRWLSERASPVPPRDAAELVAALTDAVEFAHRHGILHRDIKPSNVLLPTTLGALSPRLMDFGLAKLPAALGDETRSGVLLGTPQYMAPELAAGKLREVGPATDVYGLGAVLYESLSGRPPFRGENDAETLQQVIHAEPVELTRLRPGLSKELAAICHKCLEKRGEHRYASAASLAADLRRYLGGHVTEARPATPLSRLEKWARRRPAVAGLSAALAAAIVVGLASGALLSIRLAASLAESRSATQRLEYSERSARGRIRAEVTRAAYNAALASDLPRARTLLDGQPGSSAGAPLELGYRWLRKLARSEHRRMEVGSAIYALAASNDGTMIATGTHDGFVRLWNVADGSLRHEYQFPPGMPMYSLAISPDGNLLASGGGNMRASQVAVWDIPGRFRRMEFEGPPLTVNSVAFSPNGRWLAAAGSGGAAADGAVAEIRVWECDVSQRSAPGVAVHQWFSPPRVLQSSEWPIATSATFSADSANLAVGYSRGGSGGLGVWDVAAATEQPVATTDSTVWAVAFADRGKQLIAGDWDGTITSWRFPGREQIARRQILPGGRVMALAVAPDDRSLFVANTYLQAGNSSYEVTKWDVGDDLTLQGAVALGAGECRALVPSGDGTALWTGGAVGILSRWLVDAPAIWTSPLPLHNTPTHALVWSRNGTALATLQNADIMISDAALSAPTKAPRPVPAGAAAVSFAEDDGTLIALARDGHFYQYEEERWDGPLAFPQTHRASDDPRTSARITSFDTAASLLAVATVDGHVRVWNLQRRVQLLESHVQEARVVEVRLSADGALVAAALENGWVRVWDTASGRIVDAWQQSAASVSLAFAPGGALLLGGDGRVWLRKLLEPDIGSEVFAEAAGILALDVSAVDGTLAIASDDGIALWDLASKELQCHLPSPNGTVERLRFAANANALAAVVGPRVVVWTADDHAAKPQPPSIFDARPAPRPLTATGYAVRVREVGQLWQLGRCDEALQRAKILENDWTPARDAFELGYLRRLSNGRTKPVVASGDGIASAFAAVDGGKPAVIGSNHGKLTIFAAPDRVERVMSTGSSIQALAFTPDGQRMFSASTTRPWDVRSHRRSDGQTELIQSLAGGMNALSVSPHGRWLVFGGHEPGKVSLHRYELTPTLRELPAIDILSRNNHDESAIPICRFAWSADSRQLAVGHGNDAIRGCSGMVTLWDTDTWQEAAVRFTGFNHWVSGLAYSPDGLTLAASSFDGTLRLWDVQTNRPRDTLYGNAGPARTLAFVGQGQEIVTGHALAFGNDKPGCLLLWNLARRACVARTAQFPRAVVGLAALPGEHALLVATEDRAIQTTEITGHEVYRLIQAHEGPVHDMEFAADGSLFTVGADRALKRWDLVRGTTVQTPLELEDAALGLSLGPADGALAAFGRGAKVIWRDRNTGTPLRTSHELPQELACVTQAASGVTAAADVLGKLARWDASGQMTIHPQTPYGPIEHLTYTDAKGHMAVGACDEKVVFWDTIYGNAVWALPARGRVRCLAVSPNRAWVGAGNEHGLFTLWNVADGQQINASRLGGAIIAAAFSPDAQTVALVEEGGALGLYNVPTLEPLLPLSRVHGEVRQLCFSPDNRFLAAGLGDGSLMVWQAK